MASLPSSEGMGAKPREILKGDCIFAVPSEGISRRLRRLHAWSRPALVRASLLIPGAFSAPMGKPETLALELPASTPARGPAPKPGTFLPPGPEMNLGLGVGTSGTDLAKLPGRLPRSSWSSCGSWLGEPRSHRHA